MGGQQSKEAIVLPVTPSSETTIKFSPALLSSLSSNLASAETAPERETALDVHVRARIQAEVERLRQEEAEVKKRIDEVLKKESENLGRERAVREVVHEDGKVASSSSLREDVEAVRRAVEQYQKRRAIGLGEEVEKSRANVVKCYRDNQSRPLDCWREVEEFKERVASVEQKFVDSLR